ncbi:loader of DNA helicase [Sinorhizobium phage phiN3]|nr:loader of DNA helicase [Sinorhizobium phage phiN3]AKF13404.1 loader of DNA helicase [Sinorhizobium phage phiN3]
MSSGLVTKDSFELFQYYLALKQHFNNESYDFFKYGGKVSVTPQALENRKDKSFFYSIAKKQRNPKGYVFANVLHNPSVWIGDIAQDKDNSDKTFVGWERRMQSLSYTFREEIGNLNNDDFDSNFLCQEGRHPPLLKVYLQKKLCLETLVILDMILSFSRYWDKQMKGDPVWSEISKRIKKYKPFLEIDLPKFKGLLKDKFV